MSQAQAHAEARTLYPKSRKGADYTSSVLKLSSNAKLGKRITKGAWKGATIFTLTLEERATCPSDCAMWSKCYGDNMPFAHRISLEPSELMRRLASEVAEACSTYKLAAVRLHVLGDFLSIEYVAFWRELMARHDNLRVWGYTAHKWHTPIGLAIAQVNRELKGRWLVRFSNNEEADNTPDAGIYSCAVDTKSDYVGCPEQTGQVESCAACGICWNANVKRGIGFFDHSKGKKKT